MTRRLVFLSLLLGLEAYAAESPYLTDTRQLIFTGRRSGEGYFSKDGGKLVFQSEREAGNPFYQIYVLDFETGDTVRVSPGMGKTTCAWLHPDGKRVMFASTHADPKSKDLQEAEIKSRTAGTQKRYAWDYDPNYEIWECGLDGSSLKQISRATGYDAEGNYSPDGQSIVFASNRIAYGSTLPEDDRKRLEIQPQYFMEIYTMKADGTDVKRLTAAPGYDGGPFFSADGRKICWRRFNEDETRAEVWTMNVDGSDQRQVTNVGAMSWAPYWHPSGKYLIFTTNKHGFDNFELYMVDADGKHEPVRVTEAEGFDGLPAFSPDGSKLAWTSNRTAEKTSQLFLAGWNHAAALAALGLDGSVSPAAPAHPGTHGLAADISPADIKRHVEYLASDALEGRGTGTPGEALATSYVADLFQAWGLKPAGDENGWLHAFEFTAGVELGTGNALAVTGAETGVLKPEADWLPLTFSSTGDVGEPGKESPAVFAGYGLEVPEEQDQSGKKQEAYSSYFHLDVKDKWVLLLRYVPEGLNAEERVRYARHSSLRNKAMTARQKGARGIIVVSGPASKVREQLVPLAFDASLAGSGIAAISVTDAVGTALLKSAGKDLAALQTALDKGEQSQGFDLPGVSVTAKIDIRQEKRIGHNVIGVLAAPAPAPGGKRLPALVIGAHIDHLGRSGGTDSRASDGDKNAIHHGADDNASGTAGMLEIAQWLAAQVKEGKVTLQRDVIFAGWSGEELGLLGSAAWCRTLAKQTGNENAMLDAVLCANLNMDMIGRLRKSLILQGLGSSDWWAGEIEKRNAVLGLSLQTQQDCFVSTDATTFYLRGVPILNAFTGPHEDYHKPSDTADKVDSEGAAKITRFMGMVARTLAAGTDAPVWKEQKRPEESRGGMRVYLGTIPDYAQDSTEGVKLSGVAPGGPAAKAGIAGGDVIVKLAGKELKNIYDYTFVLGALKVGQAAEIEVLRGTERLKFNVVPGSRD